MSEYLSVRRDGNFLFRYNPQKKVIHVKRGKKEWYIDLEEEAQKAAQEPEPMSMDEALKTIRRIAKH